jgi:hypothetical protein
MKLGTKFAVGLLLTSIATIAMLVWKGNAALDETSDGGQSLRMYFVFVAYLLVLITVRAILKSQSRERSDVYKRKVQLFRIAIASVAIGGAIFILLSVAALMVGGVSVFRSVFGGMLFLVPAFIVASIPIAAKWLR